MKIGIDARALMDKNYSGISSYTSELLNAFLKYENLNSFILFYNSYNKINSLSDWQQRGCQIFRTKYPNKIFNYIMQSLLAYPKLDKVLGEVDIFFAPHLNFIKLSHKKKFVLTIHDLSFLRHPEFFSIRKNFWHYALNIKNLINKANHIIAASNSTRNDLIELLKVKEEKISVIYAGNDYQAQAKNRLNELRNNIGFTFSDDMKSFLQAKNINKPFILYLGNIEPRKNISGLIEAYNMLRLNDKRAENTQLVLAGGLGWKTKSILQSREKSPFKKDILFLGYVSKSEKEFLYQQAKIFVYPSFYEGFGFPPLEAASFALPVITSHVSSLPEIMADGALFVNPYNISEIAEAMALMLYDEDLRNRFIMKGLERAQQFLWQQTASEYINIFKKINESKK